MPDQLPDRILVTGANGMLGAVLCNALGPAAIPTDRDELDITNPGCIATMLDSHKPVAIVNCAAWTDVDGAETNRETAFALNAGAVSLLAEAAKSRGIYLLTIGTDYVFTGAGDAPWPEDAPPDAFGPTSVYGESKLAAESAVREAGGKFCFVRTQWLYGAGGKNFIDTIAGLMAQRGAAGPALKIVNDQVGAPTWVNDLAAGICTLLARRAEGFYHVANSGYGSWYDVAEFVKQTLNLECPLQPCATSEFPRPAQRPHNSRLAQEKYAALTGAPMRHWHAAVVDYLAQGRR